MGDCYGINPNHLGQPPGLGGLLHLGSFSSHMLQGCLPLLVMFLLLWLGVQVTPGYRSLTLPFSLVVNATTGWGHLMEMTNWLQANLKRHRYEMT
jgi:hypothetical protein